MFHKIYHMFSDIKKKKETNVALLLTSMSDIKDTNKVRKTTVNSHENHQNYYNFQLRTIGPPDLHQGQSWGKCSTLALNVRNISRL